MLSCYKVNFSTIRYGRDADSNVTSDRYATPKSRFIVGSSTLSVHDYVQQAELVEGVDEVHVQHVAEIAKDVTVIPAAVEASPDTHLADDHPQMSGMIP